MQKFGHQRFDRSMYEKIEGPGSWVQRINRELGTSIYGLVRGKRSGNFVLVAWRGDGAAFTSLTSFVDLPDRLPLSTASRYIDVPLDEERGGLTHVPSLDVVLRDLSRPAEEAWAEEERAIEETKRLRDQHERERRERMKDYGKFLGGMNSPLPSTRRDHPHVKDLAETGMMPEGSVRKD